MSDSPIFKILSSLEKAIFNIAPERAEELQRITQELNISLSIEIDEQPNTGFYFNVEVNSGTVKTSISSLEYLWSTVQLHWVYYIRYRRHLEAEVDIFDWAYDESVAPAIKQLECAVENLNSPKKTDIWIHSSIIPPVNRNDIAEETIEESFLCAFAWIMHHEIAHTRLGHGIITASRAMADEKEADLSATDWIVGHTNDSEPKHKRRMAVVSALMALLELPASNIEKSSTHPHTFQRLDDCITFFDLEPNNEIYRFAAIVLQIHLARLSHTDNTEAVNGSFESIYSEYLYRRSTHR